MEKKLLKKGIILSWKFFIYQQVGSDVESSTFNSKGSRQDEIQFSDTIFVTYKYFSYCETKITMQAIGLLASQVSWDLPSWLSSNQKKNPKSYPLV